MLMIPSPAKKLSLKISRSSQRTQPQFPQETQTLVHILKDLGPVDLARLMKISDKLAELNYDRYQAWSPTPAESAQAPAIFAFQGDVYQGLSVQTLSAQALDYLQQHLRILSGLYGLLRPYDLIQAYRLEMGTPLENPQGKNLYDFWQNKITQALQGQFPQDEKQELVNLASNEYAKAIDFKNLNARIITPVFKDWKNGRYKIINFYAKKARGLMARFAAENAITQAEDLKAFNLAGYGFDPELSNETTWVFTRQAA